MRVMITSDDIKKTSKGFRVDKKANGQPRLRKTFSTYEEAEIVLTRYLEGKGEQMAVTATAKVTWRTLFDNAVRREWRKKKTTTQQDNAVRVIEAHLGWDTDVRQFDQTAADALAEALEVEGRALTTVSRYLSAVRYMLRLGSEWDIITWKVPKLEHHKQPAEGRINFFDYDEEKRIANIMRQIDRADMADLFVVLVETGMRTAEAAYLQWPDVDLEHRVIRIWGEVTKTGKSRRVPITDKAYAILYKLYASRIGVRVFPRATKSFMRSTWESVRKATGNDNPDFVWYTTRHTCATRLIQAGVDVKTIQMWLGHARIETTMRYIQFSSGSLINAAGALDSARRLTRQADTADTNVA